MMLYKKLVLMVWVMAIGACTLDKPETPVDGYVCKGGKLYEAHSDGPFLYDLKEIGVCTCVGPEVNEPIADTAWVKL